MLQLLDLAKENAELKRELTRVRLEAEALNASSLTALFRVPPGPVRTTSARSPCRKNRA